MPGKNTVDFFGKPIIQHVVEIAKKSQLFEEVVVSTDSEQVMDIVKDLCRVYIRPGYLCGDVSEADVLIDFCYSEGQTVICRVYPFAALLTKDRLIDGMHAFLEDAPERWAWDSVLEVVHYEHPAQRAMRILHDGEILYTQGDQVDEPTENLTTLYHDAGTYMFSTVDALRRPLAKRRIKGIPVSRLEAQDIDTADDLTMARLKYMHRLQG